MTRMLCIPPSVSIGLSWRQMSFNWVTRRGDVREPHSGHEPSRSCRRSCGRRRYARPISGLGDGERGGCGLLRHVRRGHRRGPRVQLWGRALGRERHRRQSALRRRGPGGTQCRGAARPLPDPFRRAERCGQTGHEIHGRDARARRLVRDRWCRREPRPGHDDGRVLCRKGAGHLSPADARGDGVTRLLLGADGVSRAWRPRVLRASAARDRARG